MSSDERKATIWFLLFLAAGWGFDKIRIRLLKLIKE
jgi:hypothetical protein